ncbi:AT hook, DNA-binding motif-containing protein [Heracleum sosnowskyi]|uniref:AT hook, DNA-binding motif-containing protein n=1 Tax=Heracleum sosnowskyi TaxID=360622 RepID=A0AAD8HRM4_9APIA|nr:AT hook, DNA-binding motif-containing protein [Heracleum sosnowskyi]
MATEPVSKPPSLPPYPEMIMGAIDALKEKDGLSKSSIGRHIESTYGDLPAGHTNSLTEHLNKLKEDGELVLVKNNYMRPDPNAPPKRGRGRPPKAKDPNAPELTPVAAPAATAAVAAADGPSSRGRGRPRKDPNAPPSVKKAKTEKPKEDEKEDDKEDPTPSKSGRPRGRPRKVQPALAQNGVEAN